jgi:hypothetical protein
MVAPYAGTRPIPAERAGTAILILVTNPIESTFATARHRTIRSKGCLSNKTALAMVFKLVEAAQLMRSVTNDRFKPPLHRGRGPHHPSTQILCSH